MAASSTRRAFRVLLGVSIVLALPGLGLADDNVPPGVSGFPAGYFLPCSQAPKAAVLIVPAPFDRFMRVLCTRAGHALAPPPGFHWVFANGMSAWLSALSPRSALVGQDAYFSRLEATPLTADQAEAIRRRVAPIVRTPDMLKGEVLRLALDTSTGEHRQEYLFVSRDASGTPTRAWGIECFHDCEPMDAQPWAFMVEPDKPDG
jgi:hypothetical protein